MKRFIWIFVAFALAATAGCVKQLEEVGITDETELIGRVVEKSSSRPLPNIKVQVTDGEHIHANATTDEEGAFSLKIDFRKLTSDYYLLLDGSPSLPSRQEELHGFGYTIYDYKSVVLFDMTDTALLPQVATGDVSNVTGQSAVVGGSVLSGGANQLTGRGVCFATHQSPTVADQCVAAGAEVGTFSCTLSGLQTGVTYYVRAYATNSIGTAYGNQKSFSTDGLPSVTTTAPTRAGTTVTTGGIVTSDGGYPVTARGVCYSRTPHPDLGSAHSHTTDGSGSGSYSSSFSMNIAGTYYVRAYATNANGTAYGEQQTINHPYYDLPTFTFGGRTYRVAPPADNVMNWSDANAYCNNLTLYGYSDWRLPTKDELQVMWSNRGTIGGFNSDDWWSGTSYNSTGTYHYSVDCRYGNSYYRDNSNLYYVRPVRVEN